MNDRRDDVLEPERYELREAPAYRLEASRRDLLRALGGGLLVLVLGPRLDAQERERGGQGRGTGEDDELSAWLHVDPEGCVTVYTGKVEVGQGIRTSLTLAVAEELALPPARVRLVMADTERVPYDRGTFGSRTTPTMAPQLARAAAAAREALIALARERWRAGADEPLEVRDGCVVRSGGEALGFAELASGQELVARVERDRAVTAPAAWRVCGRSIERVNARAIVTGAHRYASDVALPGMLHGKVLRPPAFGARRSALELSGARALGGVTVVHDGDFVGVAAASPALASRALAAIDARWEEAPQVASEQVFEHLRRGAPGDAGGARARGGPSVQSEGSIEAGLAAADRRLAATYTVAYIAHAPLETRAAIAEWRDEALTVWTGTQRPFGVRAELAQALALPEERVRVVVPDTGSGYGGKHTGEAALEAALLARAAGRPVKVCWTREEEFTWAYARPGGVIEVESGARADGTILAWRCHNYNSGSSALRSTYAIPHQELGYHPSDSPLRQGSYRGLAATANHFARETHLDELARELGLDPLELRLRNLADERQRAVLVAAAERFGWGRPARAGMGVGIAAGFEKGGYVATCAEVAVDPRREPSVERLVVAFECGAIHDPDGLENQVVGAVIQGLGGALFERLEFADGRIRNARFSRYRVPRMADVPPVEALLLDRRDLPSAGAGEAPIVAVAPALGNALFDATGERKRSLPLA